MITIHYFIYDKYNIISFTVVIQVPEGPGPFLVGGKALTIVMVMRSV